MKKTILSLAIMIVAGLGFSTFAETPENTAGQQKSEMRLGKKDRKKDFGKKHRKGDKHHKSGKGCKDRRNCFDTDSCYRYENCNADSCYNYQNCYGRRNCYNADSCRYQSKGLKAMKGIELTPEQKARIEKAEAKMKEKVQKIRSEARTDCKKATGEYNEEVKKVLTAEQYAKYEKNLKTRKARFVKSDKLLKGAHKAELKSEGFKTKNMKVADKKKGDK